MNKVSSSSLSWLILPALAYVMPGQETAKPPLFDPRNDDVTVTISPPGAGCEVVLFPVAWRYSKPKNPKNSDLQWRSSRKDNHVYYAASLDVFDLSLNKYRVRAGRKITLEPATDEEWAAAVPLRPQFRATEEDRPMGYSEDGSAIYRKGKMFPRMGERFAPGRPALMSPDHRFIVMHSFDGMYPGPARTKEDLNGSMYAEIFDTASGQKLVSVVAKFSRNTASQLSGHAGWYAPDLLCLDYMVREKRSTVLCHFEHQRKP